MYVCLYAMCVRACVCFVVLVCECLYARSFVRSLSHTLFVSARVCICMYVCECLCLCIACLFIRILLPTCTQCVYIYRLQYRIHINKYCFRVCILFVRCFFCLDSLFFFSSSSISIVCVYTRLQLDPFEQKREQ